MDMKHLSNKLVLVTGGGSGIGKECCKMFASNGAIVIVSDLNIDAAEATKKVLNSNGLGKHSSFPVDVSNDSVEKLKYEILRLYGRPPSIVIHSAGIIGQPVESENCPEELYQKIVDVNLKGTFLVNKIFAKEMKEAAISGSIVNISSIAKDGFPHHLAYSASKSGVVGITKTIAQEFGMFNIRCNAVAPGAVQTPMCKEVPSETVSDYVHHCALKRVGRPEEIASVCLFLGSDASSYVNGIVMKVDGGAIYT